MSTFYSSLRRRFRLGPATMRSFLGPKPMKILFLSALQGFACYHVFSEHLFAKASTVGPSMLPTFEMVGESAIVDKRYRRGRGVEVGDLVVYDIPTEPTDQGIKRVLGLPGDYVLINSPESGSDAMIQVPTGHCWIIGDNLPASRDSRHFGPLPLALVRGKVIAKWRPWRRVENPLRRPDPEP